MSDEGFLSRWSRRKRAAASGVQEPQPAPSPASPAAAVASAPAGTPAAPETAPPAPLPPVESLSIESDFLPFMAKEVDPALQRAALRKLFQDERFYVMDGLDVYIDDYTKPAPIPPEWYERMAQMALLGDAAPKPPPGPAAEGDDPVPPATAQASANYTDAADISHSDVSPAPAAPVRGDGASG